MRLAVKEIVTLVQGRLQGDANRMISGAAGLEEAQPSDLSFIRDSKDKKSLDKFHRSRAGCVIVPKGLSENGKTLIEVPHPLEAFVKILHLLESEKKPVRPAVHASAQIASSVTLGQNVSVGPCAVLDEGAVIGDGTVIGAHVFVGARSKIGKNTLVYPNVTIREDSSVGNNCILHSGCVIGADGFGFYFANGKHNKIPQVGNVVIEDEVEIGACSTIDRAMIGSTRI